MSINPDEGVLDSVADLDDAAQALLAREFLPTRQLELSANIPAGERETESVRMPFDGYVLGVYLRVPDGGVLPGAACREQRHPASRPSSLGDIAGRSV